MFYTTDQLLESIKLRSLAPISQSTFADSDLVMFLNEELQLHLVPDILATREDFFLTSKQVAVTANTSNYPVPERAMGNALKQVYWVDAGGTKYRLIMTDVDIQTTIGDNGYGQPGYFYFEGDEIVLYPTPTTAGGFIEFWYFQRANQLVLTEEVTRITAVNTVGATTTFTVDTDLTGSITAASTKTDILSATSPFLLWSQNVIPTAITTSTIAYTTTDLANDSDTLPVVGDYISLAQRANIPMVPQEFHPILAQMVSARLLEALGDNAKLQPVMAKLQMMRESAMKLIANRVEHQPKRILNRQGFVWATGWGPWRNS